MLTDILESIKSVVVRAVQFWQQNVRAANASE